MSMERHSEDFRGFYWLVCLWSLRGLVVLRLLNLRARSTDSYARGFVGASIQSSLRVLLVYMFS